MASRCQFQTLVFHLEVDVNAGEVDDQKDQKLVGGHWTMKKF